MEQAGDVKDVWQGCRVPRLARFGLVALVACVVAGAAGGARAPVRFTLFVQTDLSLGGIAQTPSGWVYTSENIGRFRTSDARGRALKELAQIDQGGEEVRCEASPGGAGFVKGAVYCHFPDDRIVRLRANGTFDVVTTLPHAVAADGAMAFDTGGLFARGAIVAATGGSASNGGDVYLVRGNGRVSHVGSYPGPGGADNLVIAPARFGPASRWAALAIDQTGVSGRVLAVGPRGQVRELAAGLGKGVNPIAVIRAAPKKRPRRSPRPGLYLADTIRKSVYVATAAQLRPYVNSVVVGTELTADFWIIRSTTAGYRATPLPTSLERTTWNLESAVYVR
jgi:hypothetical protein